MIPRFSKSRRATDHLAGSEEVTDGFAPGDRRRLRQPMTATGRKADAAPAAE
ncbi:MAG: hypothetical protein KIT22_08905 [Verrucomicrobiae bacterium]|nr:hypothetical protein [Verrucomicrobiae bacterium]